MVRRAVVLSTGSLLVLMGLGTAVPASAQDLCVAAAGEVRQQEGSASCQAAGTGSVAVVIGHESVAIAVGGNDRAIVVGDHSYAIAAVGDGNTAIVVGDGSCAQASGGGSTVVVRGDGIRDCPE